MSNAKNSKLDWETNMPRMIELYKTGLSIPKIHEAVQTEHFKPGLRIVYSRFNSEGYPTDIAERAKLLNSLSIAGWPRPATPAIQQVPQHPWAFLTSNIATSNEISSPRAMALNQHYLEVRGTQTEDSSTPLSYSNLELIERQVHYTDGCPEIFQTHQDLQTQHTFHFEPDTFEITEWNDDPEPNFLVNNQIMVEKDVQVSALSPAATGNTFYEHSQPSQLPSSLVDWPRQEQTALDNSNTQRHLCGFNKELYALHESPVRDDCNTPDLVDIPSPSSLPQTPVAKQYRPWPSHLQSRPRFSKISNPEHRISSATSDSGYASGRDSPFSVQTPRSDHCLSTRPPLHNRSLEEFRGLYRAPCRHFHEPEAYNEFFGPQNKDRYRDIPTCQYCQYSAIHNLSWSARFLKYEVFLAELKLDSKYETGARDAAGNTALHFAATGGARFEHLRALIANGVNPYHINTAGQLFLHCLRPCITRSGVEAELIETTAFNLDLVNLLNELTTSHSGTCRWRDNTGRTALEALVDKLQSEDAKAQTVLFLGNAGYSLCTSSRFNSTFTVPIHGPATDAFDFNRQRQKIAWEINGRASSEPSYVDPETGDSVLHALSRLRFPNSADLIARIQDFTSKDVDLNLPNREQDCPISAFTREPPVEGGPPDETGATISKYLDVLLWKDKRCRVSNKTNVNMRNLEGATPLYYAAIRARPDSVRSLIEAGANVNARLEIDGHQTSILCASKRAKEMALRYGDVVKIHQLTNVISYLEHEKAVDDPTPRQERSICDNTVLTMPL